LFENKNALMAQRKTTGGGPWRRKGLSVGLMSFVRTMRLL
jgi:hypothetical protein